tara:strand:- start:2060 stop:3244 length:1185 start_codon:yes stop_codon:yes gene_type:complete
VYDEIEAFRSFVRGLSPSKHVALLAEQEMANSVHHFARVESVCLSSISMKDVRIINRRFRKICQCRRDLDGVYNILNYLEKSDLFHIKYMNITDYDDERPMIIFLSLKSILKSKKNYENVILGLDATYGVTVYQVALFVIMGRTDGGALPLGYFISSSKSEVAVSIGLVMFRTFVDSILLDEFAEMFGHEFALSHYKPFEPVGFCIDKDDGENNAISQVFPNSVIILCHYHYMVIVSNEARASRHNLNDIKRAELIALMRRITSCSTEESFKECLIEIKHLSESFFEYFSKNFLNSRWISSFSEVVRQNFTSSARRLCRSNMLVEVSFKTLKYVIFGGLQNRRLDELLYSICFRLFPYFQVRSNSFMTHGPRLLTSTSSATQGTLLFRLVYFND